MLEGDGFELPVREHRAMAPSTDSGLGLKLALPLRRRSTRKNGADRKLDAGKALGLPDRLQRILMSRTAHWAWGPLPVAQRILLQHARSC